MPHPTVCLMYQSGNCALPWCLKYLVEAIFKVTHRFYVSDFVIYTFWKAPHSFDRFFCVAGDEEEPFLGGSDDEISGDDEFDISPRQIDVVVTGTLTAMSINGDVDELTDGG